MTHFVWKLVFLFSLAVNICFVVGYLRMQDVVKKHATAHSRMALILDSLQLDTQQSAATDHAMDDWTQKMHTYQMSHAEEADRCWGIVQRDDSPEPATREAIQSASDIQKGATIISLDFIRKVMVVLNPSQRKKLTDTIRNGYKF